MPDATPQVPARQALAHRALNGHVSIGHEGDVGGKTSYAQAIEGDFPGLLAAVLAQH
jgi:hypothetical protein